MTVKIMSHSDSVREHSRIDLRETTSGLEQVCGIQNFGFWTIDFEHFDWYGEPHDQQAKEYAEELRGRVAEPRDEF